MSTDKVNKEHSEVLEPTDIIGRELPPVFPLAIRIGTTDDICIMDFLDVPAKNTRRVFYSVAITKDHAKRIISGLQKFIEQ